MKKLTCTLALIIVSAACSNVEEEPYVVPSHNNTIAETGTETDAGSDEVNCETIHDVHLDCYNACLTAHPDDPDDVCDLRACIAVCGEDRSRALAECSESETMQEQHECQADCQVDAQECYASEEDTSECADPHKDSEACGGNLQACYEECGS